MELADHAGTPPSLAGGFFPGSLSKSTPDTRVRQEATLGVCHRIYTGPKARIQWGLPYSDVTRDAWSGVGFSPGIGSAPHGLHRMVFSSFRYSIT